MNPPSRKPRESDGQLPTFDALLGKSADSEPPRNQNAQRTWLLILGVLGAFGVAWTGYRFSNLKTRIDDLRAEITSLELKRDELMKEQKTLVAKQQALEKTIYEKQGARDRLENAIKTISAQPDSKRIQRQIIDLLKTGRLTANAIESAMVKEQFAQLDQPVGTILELLVNAGELQFEDSFFGGRVYFLKSNKAP